MIEIRNGELGHLEVTIIDQVNLAFGLKKDESETESHNKQT